MLSLYRLSKRLLPALMLAVVVFTSCVEEVGGRVVPIGDKESYAVSDTAILYVMAGDTARVQVQYNLDADTVTSVDIQLIFEKTEHAEDFFASYSTDSEIDNINFDGSFISYTTSNYNGLHRSEIINILKGKYVINEKQADAVSDTPHDFTPRAFIAPADGMYIIVSRPLDDNSTLFWSGSTAKPQTAKSIVRSDVNPWRLFRAKSLERGSAAGRWLIQLSNGRYLRRSGNRLAPLALTTCAMPQQATAWNLQQVINSFNLWTLHTDITSTSDFYGIICGKDNTIDIGISALDTYSFLASPVTLRFLSKGEVVNTIESLWGCLTILPMLDTNTNKSNEEGEGTTFIGWNTIPDQVDGYLAPGSIVEADNTTYYAIFVKSE